MNETRYWRSLEELADTAEFRAFVEDEFPQRTPDWNDAGSRRRFLTLMGASVALAGGMVSTVACTVQPKELIVPYVRQPEELVLGNPLFYATAMCVGGLLIESHLGRPTKVEGTLVVLFFMHVKQSSSMTKLFVAAGFFWMAILLVFVLSDYFSRGWLPVGQWW
jgi:MoCo/4Fe-4S cofactor protein with predicted Tat translocation signal